MKNTLFFTKSERGQSFAELALVFPILIIFMAVLFDLGRFTLAYMELRDAAQEGTNYASIYAGTPSDFATNVTTRVRASADFPIDLTDTSQVSVSVSPSSGLCTGSRVTVTVNYHFPVAAPFIGMFLDGQKIPINAIMSGMVLLPGC